MCLYSSRTSSYYRETAVWGSFPDLFLNPGAGLDPFRNFPIGSCKMEQLPGAGGDPSKTAPAEIELTIAPRPTSGAPARTTSSARIDGKISLALFPPEVQVLLTELDADNSGALELSEVANAVRMLKESRKSNQRLRYTILALIAIVAVLVASIFGALHSTRCTRALGWV